MVLRHVIHKFLPMTCKKRILYLQILYENFKSQKYNFCDWLTTLHTVIIKKSFPSK